MILDSRLLRAIAALASIFTYVLIAAPAAASSVLSLAEIRNTGIIMQKWDTSCGAAALATVFTYHFEDPVSEREVAAGLLRQTEPLKVKYRGGFSLLDMKRYAKERGYDAAGFRDLTFEELRYINAPIVPINQFGYNHYVVFKGVVSEREVLLGDPAFGNFRMRRDKFENIWMNGMAFTLRRESN